MAAVKVDWSLRPENFEPVPVASLSEPALIDSETPFDVLARNEESTIALACLGAACDERELSIIAMRFGIGAGCEPVIWKDIAKHYSRSRPRMRKVYLNAIRRARMRYRDYMDHEETHGVNRMTRRPTRTRWRQ